MGLIRRSPASVQDQVSGGTFFDCEMCIQSSVPSGFAAVSVVRSAGQVPSNRARGLSTSDDASRIPSHKAPNCNQWDPLHWDPGKLL